MGDTIIEHKKAFLNSQIRILNTRLEPSRHWRDNLPIPEQGEIKGKVVQEVLHKLNTIVQHHNRAVYSLSRGTDVAEQIDRLYWASGATDPHTGHIMDETIDRAVNLRDHSVITSLPDEWPEEDDEQAAADESGLEQFADTSRYKQLRASLVSLSEQREAQLRKLDSYKHLHRLLQPFKNPQEIIQPNLIIEDGELTKELERMKILMARAGEKLKGLEVEHNDNEGNEEGELFQVDTEKKITAILINRP
ncbi:hypothetical protein MMC06_003281 [Schaereria dolodes]|nr:hypothetical protein [Schaereria dolodes]